MKTVKKITAAMTALVMLGSLGSCMSVRIGNTYENAEKYTAGDREFSEKVSSIMIDWSSGSVNVEYQDSDKVSVTETCNKELKGSEQVHTWLDGETLRVQFCESGYIFKADSVEKKLDIKIPKDSALTVLDLDGASCSYTFDSISADCIDVDVSSGDGKIMSCTARTFDVDSSSGNLELTQKGSSDSIETDSSSGNVVITAETAGSVDCGSSSGKISITASEAKNIKASASSGSVTASLSAMPESIKISTSSGSVDLTLPENADFSADIDTATGGIDTGIPMKKKGDTYISGSGSNEIEIDTSSGDITLQSAS